MYFATYSQMNNYFNLFALRPVTSKLYVYFALVTNLIHGSNPNIYTYLSATHLFFLCAAGLAAEARLGGGLYL